MHTTSCDKGVISFSVSRNFDNQMSSNFHSFIILCIMLRCTKWEDWSLTILPMVSSVFKGPVTCPWWVTMTNHRFGWLIALSFTISPIIERDREGRKKGNQTHTLLHTQEIKVVGSNRTRVIGMWFGFALLGKVLIIRSYTHRCVLLKPEFIFFVPEKENAGGIPLWNFLFSVTV